MSAYLLSGGGHAQLQARTLLAATHQLSYAVWCWKAAHLVMSSSIHRFYDPKHGRQYLSRIKQIRLLMFYMALHFGLADRHGSLVHLLVAALRLVKQRLRFPVVMTVLLLLEELMHLVALYCTSTQRPLIGVKVKPVDNDVCCICHDTVSDAGDKHMYDFCSTRRNHMAHWGCMHRWMNSGQAAHGSCPLCLEPLVTGQLSMFTALTQRTYWHYFLRRYVCTCALMVSGQIMAGMVTTQRFLL